MRAAILFFVCASSLIGACGTTRQGMTGDTYLARKRLARELVARQDWSAAFLYADGLHRERPKDAAVLALRGTIYREQGLDKEAEADFKQALSLDGSLAEAHAALGLLFDKTGQGIDAEKHHRKAVELDAENSAYLNNLGFSLFLRRKHAEAIEAYQKAVRLDPTNHRIRTNLGFAYAGSGDWPRAAYEFTRGARTPAQAKNNLAFAYERRGDLSTAYGLYLEAVRLDPRCQQARANLIALGAQLGRDTPDDLPEEGLGEAPDEVSTSASTKETKP